MIIFPDPVPTLCPVLWEMVLSLQCRRAIELVSSVQMSCRLVNSTVGSRTGTAALYSLINDQ